MVAQRIETPTQIIKYAESELKTQYDAWGVSEQHWCSQREPVCIPFRDGPPVTSPIPTNTFYVSRDFGNQFSFEKQVTLSENSVGQFAGTIVLLHGYGAKKESWLQTGFYFQALGFRVIEPDLMGQGESSSKLGFGVKDGELLAEFIASLTAANDDPIVLIGHSMGALAAVKTATLSDRISGLVLLAPMDRFDRAAIGVAHAFRPILSNLIPDNSISSGAELALSRVGLTLSQTNMMKDMPRLSIPILTYGSSLDQVSNIRSAEAWAGYPNVTRIVNNNETHMSVIGIGNEEHDILMGWLGKNIPLHPYISVKR